MNKLTATLLVLLGAASFGVLSTVVKLAYTLGFSTAQVTGSQVALGCLLLWLLSIPSWRSTTRLTRTSVISLLASGTFNGLTGIFYYLALQNIPASLAVILLFQFTWMGMLVDWLWHKHAPTRSQWLALLLVLLGTILAAGLHSNILISTNPVGIVLGLLAAASYTGFINVSGRVALEVPPALRSALLITGATVLTLIVFPPTFVIDGSLGKGLWLWAAILALFGVVIPPYLFARGVPYIGTGLATILGSIELPVVIVMSALFLHEPIDWTQWLGTLLILLGIVLTENRLSLIKIITAKRRSHP